MKFLQHVKLFDAFFNSVFWQVFHNYFLTFFTKGDFGHFSVYKTHFKTFLSIERLCKIFGPWKAFRCFFHFNYFLTSFVPNVILGPSVHVKHIFKWLKFLQHAKLFDAFFHSVFWQVFTNDDFGHFYEYKTLFHTFLRIKRLWNFWNKKFFHTVSLEVFFF